MRFKINSSVDRKHIGSLIEMHFCLMAALNIRVLESIGEEPHERTKFSSHRTSFSAALLKHFRIPVKDHCSVFFAESSIWSLSYFFWHRLNLLIFRACKQQVTYYASCCGGGPLGKLYVGEQSLIFCKHISFVFRFCVKASKAMDRHLLYLITEFSIHRGGKKFFHARRPCSVPMMLDQPSHDAGRFV